MRVCVVLNPDAARAEQTDGSGLSPEPFGTGLPGSSGSFLFWLFFISRAAVVGRQREPRVLTFY